MRARTHCGGAPRIHSELLMLGIEVAQSTVARYMTKRQGPPSQGWKTFLRNHAAGIASIDLFCGSYDLLQAALRPGNSSPRAKANGEHQRDEQSDRRVDRRTGDRCISLRKRRVI
jgi:hypothetical protein